MYADGQRLLVFVPFLTVWQRVKKFFDTLKFRSEDLTGICFSTIVEVKLKLNCKWEGILSVSDN